MNQDFDIGFTIKPKDFKEFLKSQNYIPNVISDINPNLNSNSNPPLKYYIYDPAQGIWPVLLYHPDYSQDKNTFPDWRKEGYDIVSLLNVKFTLDRSGEEKSIKLARKILKTYSGTVLFDSRTRRFSNSQNLQIPSSALLI